MISLARRGKTTCPQCGHKTFVNYLYENGTAVADGQCGKCDRADKCGAHIPPREYFKGRSFAADLTIKGDNGAVYNEPDYIDRTLMERTLGHYDLNPLARWLHGIFDPKIGEDKVTDILIERHVGTSRRWGGATVFWQVDRSGKVRTGKVMGYNPLTGKRIHERNNWVHSLLTSSAAANPTSSSTSQASRPGNYNLRKCYYGSDISAENRPIWLFESEKAALIVDMVLTWGGGGLKMAAPMATCGCGNLNPTLAAKNDPYDKIQVLKDRTVVLFPDEGTFDEWMEKGRKLKRFCKEVWISTVMERTLHPHVVQCEINPGDGFDDLLLRYIDSGLDLWTLLLTSYGYRLTYRLG